MNVNKAYKLKVLAGIHKSAEVIIYANENYTIGSGDACDIIIADSEVEEKHLYLHVSEDNVTITKNCDNIFVDGEIINEENQILAEYQVVTIGEAQFAVGSAELEWPPLEPSVLINKLKISCSSDLLPLVPPPKVDDLKSKITKNLRNLLRAILKLEKRITVGIGIFIFIFILFWVDFIQSGTNDVTHINSRSNLNKQKSLHNKSLLISVNSMLGKIKDSGLVMTGVKEPSLNIDRENVFKIKPIQKVRQHLNSKWGKALIENIINEKEIEYRGTNSVNKINLDIKIKKESDGTFSAQGYTLTKDQRNGLVTKLGDIVRVKVISAEGINDMCKKIMQKKKIKDPMVQFDMVQNTVMLKGKTINIDDIPQAEELINKTFPDIRILNKIKFAPEELNIIGANISGVEYIKLNDGCKIFKGGMLKNGCIIENIKSDEVQLNCRGSIVIYKLGEKT